MRLGLYDRLRRRHCTLSDVGSIVMNEILYGKDDTEGIVGLHPEDYGSSMRLFYSDGTSEVTDLWPYFFCTSEGISHAKQGYDLAFSRNLRGDLHYGHLAVFKDMEQMRSAKGHVIDNTGGDDPVYVNYDPIQQYLMQTGITTNVGLGMDDLHRLQLDIETYSVDGFPDPTRRPDEVIIVSLSDNRGWKALLHTADVDVKHGMALSSEKDLLKQLVKVIHRRDPDTIEGHNILGFDLPYLRQRFEMKRVPFRIGRDNEAPQWWESSKEFAEREVEYEKYIIAGRSVIDSYFLAADYDTYARDLPSYGLKPIAKHFGITADDREYVKGENIPQVWDENPKRLLKYALDDAIETREVVSALGNASFALTKIVPMTWQQAIIAGTASTLESIMAREYLRQRHSIPNGSDPESFGGGYTEIFERGVWEDLAYADVSSLYPSIMLSWDVSPETDQLGVFTPMLKRLTDLRLENKQKLSELEASTQEYERVDAEQAAQKILINCFTPDHEIMTKEGRKDIEDVEVGDMVYSLNTETGEAEYKPVTRTYKQERYSGEIVNIENRYVDFQVTPNHNFWAKHENRDYDWVEAKDFFQDKQRWKMPRGAVLDGEIRHHVSLKEECERLGIDYKYDANEDKIKDPRQQAKWIPNTYRMVDWLKFAGWFVSEGSTYCSDRKEYENTVRGNSWSLTISNKTQSEQDEIRSLINRLGWSFYEGSGDFKIGNKILSLIFRKDFGDGSHTKQIPDWVFELDGRLIQNLLDKAFLGDGNKEGCRYTTSSEELKEDFIRLAFHCGKRVHEWDYDSGAYRIGYYDRTRGVRPTVKEKDRSREKYDGPIVCVEVADNHTVLAGRNGKFNWTGQSAYGMLGFPYALWSDIDAAAFVTYKGREILKEMIIRLEEEGGRVVGADTDGALFVVPDGRTADDTIAPVDDAMPEGIEIDKDYETEKALTYKAKNYAKMKEGEIDISGASLMGRQKEPFLREYIHDQLENILREDVKAVHERHEKARRDVIEGRLGAEDLCRRQRLKKTMSEYKRGVKEVETKHRLGQYEVALRKWEITGIEPKKGDTVRYYVRHEPLTTDTKVSRDARLLREYDGDEDTEYYLDRLDTTADLFRPFFDRPEIVFGQGDEQQGLFGGPDYTKMQIRRTQVNETPNDSDI